ncbi:MAG: DNA polymerase I [Chloroflexi bacterium]|nr:DNA polymerase I [Chloroflexota bacterium]
MATEQRPRLIVLDVASLLHRAYHAVPKHFATAAGEPTNAVFGFTTTLLRIVDLLAPTHAAAAFDLPGKTFRDDMFEEYKAGRPETDEALVVQFGRVRELLHVFGIPAYDLESYEADDVLGTLAVQAERAGFDVFLVTGDRDAYQLVTSHVQVLSSNPRTGEPVIYDAAAIRERWGVEPDQVVDFKGLVGDSSDNIPGVTGIGEKTASKLLQQFRDIDEIYAHLDDVAPAPRRRLEDQRDRAELSRELARIVTDLPVEFDPDRTRLWQADAAATTALMQELQFRTLMDRLPFGLAEPAADDGAPATAEITPRIVDTPAAAEELGERLLTVERAGVFPLLRDTRSGPELCGLGIAWDGDSAYAPCAPNDASLLDPLREWLASADHDKVVFDSKLLRRGLAGCGLEFGGVQLDLLLAAYLVDADATPQTIDDLAFRRLGESLAPPMVDAPPPNTLATLSPEEIAQPLAVRADACLRLAPGLEQDLDANDLTPILRDVEMPLAAVLADIESRGVAIDVDALRELSQAMQGEIETLAAAIHADAGAPFNINSPKQLGPVLFEKLGLPAGRRTKSGYSTASGVLEGLVDAHPVAQRVLDFRAVSKLKSTYADALANLVVPETGRIHTSFNQAVAATGRLSSANPNLQNIPIRTARGREIRRAFVSGADDLALLAIDYSQIELRVLAHASEDEAMCAAFREGQDIHAATAARLYGVGIADVTSDMRRLAKTTNFGIVYGISAPGLAQRTEMTFEEAQAFIDTYFATYPGVKAYMDRTIAEAHERGYVQTMLGRRRYLPGLKARVFHQRAATERVAINMPIQGAAADIIKIAMIQLDRELQRHALASRMLLQVHDELVLEVPRDELDDVVPLATASMTQAYPLRVPVVVDARVGANWRDMEEL